MRYLIGLLLSLAILFTFSSCQRRTPVSLAVDLTSQSKWDYTFSFKVGGTFSLKDLASDLFSTLHCLLKCEISPDNKVLDLAVHDLQVSSTILDSTEMWNISEQVKEARYQIALYNGFPDPRDSLIISAAKINDLGLYQHLLRIFPSLPAKAVRPGFSWERDRMLPLSTSQGVAVCNVYQSFTFDSLGSLPGNSNMAYISWLFRYSIDPDHIDSTSLIKNLPSYGNGKGFAVIDTEGKKLIKAEMVFAVPACSLPDLSISWEEVAILELVEEKSRTKE